MNYRSSITFACTTICFCLAASAWAQEEGSTPQLTPEQQAMKEAWENAATPGEAHAWLAESAGAWNVKQTIWMAPGADPDVAEGTAEREAVLGGRVVRESFSSTLQGQPFTGIAHTGFDNVSGKYWTSWFDNMSTDLWIGEGECSDDFSRCTWTVTGSDPVSGGEHSMRIEAEYSGDSETHSFYESRGGEEVKTMELVYTRSGE